MVLVEEEEKEDTGYLACFSYPATPIGYLRVVLWGRESDTRKLFDKVGRQR